MIVRQSKATMCVSVLKHISYPPYTFRITEIKYIDLIPILLRIRHIHTYTTQAYPIRSPIYPLCVYAYCVDTHWHAAHYSPPAFDRPRSKQCECEEAGKKKIAAEPPKYSNQHI
jgi:hypothetical protein